MSAEQISTSTSKSILEKGKAGYPAVYLLSPEDARSVGDIRYAAKQMNRRLFVWSFGRGFVEDDQNAGHNARVTSPIADTESPASALAALLKETETATTNRSTRATPAAQSLPTQEAIFVFRLFHHFLEDPMVQTMLILLTAKLKVSKRMIIILTPTLKIPSELEKEFALLETNLPGVAELNEVLDGLVQNLPSVDLHPSPEMRKQLIDCALGLTTSEAENAFGLAIVRPRLAGKNTWDPEVVMSEKCQSLKKTGLLQYYPPSTGGLSQVGGLDRLKTWVKRREAAFTPEAKEFGLHPPRGLLLLGIPGTGKSLCAKAVSEELKLPLLRCDMGRIFAGIVGASEENVRRVIQISERLAPCVLWIDELEKGVPSNSSGAGDSGVGARVFGSLLTWMQEKTAPVFVFATANDVSALPPELLRKGRFDEIFSVSLPTLEERKEIFAIHIGKRGRAAILPKIDLDNLAEQSEGYSGAEIEGCIDEAMFNAYEARKRTGKPTDLNWIDLADSVQSIIPLSKTMRSKIDALEEWCRTRTRPASSPRTVAQVQNQSPTSGRVVDAN